MRRLALLLVGVLAALATGCEKYIIDLFNFRETMLDFHGETSFTGIHSCLIINE